jgi:hypothetical protein
VFAFSMLALEVSNSHSSVLGDLSISERQWTRCAPDIWFIKSTCPVVCTLCQHLYWFFYITDPYRKNSILLSRPRQHSRGSCSGWHLTRSGAMFANNLHRSHVDTFDSLLESGPKGKTEYGTCCPVFGSTWSTFHFWCFQKENQTLSLYSIASYYPIPISYQLALYLYLLCS